jgi:hypothetical protein
LIVDWIILLDKSLNNYNIEKNPHF